MFRPYKAIIRHHINEDFYPIAHFLKSSFHVACYYLSIFYLVARPFSLYVGALLYISCALRTNIHGKWPRYKIKYRKIITSHMKRRF
jgi:hypothetical protein